MLQTATVTLHQPTLDTKTCHTGSYPEPIQNSAVTIHFLPTQSERFSVDSYLSQADPSREIFPVKLQVRFFCFLHVHTVQTSTTKHF